MMVDVVAVAALMVMVMALSYQVEGDGVLHMTYNRVLERLKWNNIHLT
uniref:Uncharacterized protein n=1 Tax=viral metagenome TaxID=1070528 RepID=A0A6C0LUN0_9ZZZZ